MRGVFISGTDTSIGKTVASALLLPHAKYRYKTACYYKPIESGATSDASTVRELTGIQHASRGIALALPVSPHLAAFHESIELDLHLIAKQCRSVCQPYNYSIIEGAGGLLVPINRRHLMIDLLRELSVPCLVVCSSRLGTINHTLLSIEALRNRGLPIGGIIMMGERNRHNEQAIRFYGRIDNLLVIPKLAGVDRTSIISLSQHLQAEMDHFFEPLEQKHA